jgi:hypothetical protein
MATTRLMIGSVQVLEDVFEEVTAAWGLSPSEREAVRGVALTTGRRERSRRSRFVTERMALVVEIDWLLGTRMEAREIRQWIRRRVAGVIGSSPLDDMVGSSDRLRRIRELLALEVSA